MEKTVFQHIGLHCFETAFGVAGLAWRGARIVAVCFPEGDADAARAKLRRRAADAAECAPPPEIAKTCGDIIDLFAGGQPEFSDVCLDEDGLPDFDRSVWSLTRAIPIGAIKTYGEIAREMGDVAYSQRVGQALGRNPFPIIVPCHRVVGAHGAMTGFSAAGGVEAKRRLLKLEGALQPELFD